MSERWARWMLTTYRYAGAAIYPFLGGYLGYRAARGKEEHSRRRERYGYGAMPRPSGPLVWVHAASVGESGAVIPLVEHLANAGITVVMTTGTVTSARVVAERLGNKVIHQYVPIDMKPAVDRFLDHWKPELAIIAESEIWPMTILGLGARTVPQVLVNGRLSDRSFKAWQRRSYFAEALMENLAHVVAQSETDGERFRTLGARPVTVSGNLKADTVPPPVDTSVLQRYASEIGTRKTWAAISTHDGEETIAADVHLRLRSRHKGLLTILVPRHPDRVEEITAMLKAKGLNVVRRSTGAAVTADTDILLGDTIGEMGLFLRLTEIAFVGRSLTGEGGQNPLEPAILGTAVLAGRNVQNFRDAYQRLIKNGGAKIVRDGEMLAGAVNLLLSDDKLRNAMMVQGKKTVDDMRGALTITLQALDRFIHPLVLKAQLESMDRGDQQPPRRVNGA
jgi:3-deoxy-D-manno-octulosonic-acid transferase